MSEPRWMSHAACRGHWEEGDWDDLRPANQLLVCSTCPVLAQCRADVQHLTAIGCPPSGIVQGGRLHPLRYGHTVIRPKPDHRPELPFDDNRKTCKHGHPWTPDNLAVQLGGTGHPSWVCILCSAASKRAHRAGRTLAQQIAIEAAS